MTIFKNSADASNVYTPSSAVGNKNLNSAAVNGNLSDIMKNATIFRVTQFESIYLQNTELKKSSPSEFGV